MDEQLGAPLYVPAALHALDLSLDVGPRRNHNPVVDDKGKGRLRVDGVPVLGRFGRNRLLQR